MLVGKKAPEFKLNAFVNGETKEVGLSDFKGKWLVLFFYPKDFTPVCASEVQEFNKRLSEFKQLNCEVASASVDSVESHAKWSEELGGIKYAMLSDEAKQASREYFVLNEEKGTALRGAFIIDSEGKVRYEVVHEPPIGRSVEEILRVLQALQTGKACEAEWRPGK